MGHKGFIYLFIYYCIIGFSVNTLTLVISVDNREKNIRSAVYMDDGEHKNLLYSLAKILIAFTINIIKGNC
jgi:hypothetical protein